VASGGSCENRFGNNDGKKNDNTIVKQNNKLIEFGQFSAPREIVYLLLLLL